MNQAKVNLDDFDLLKVIGRGAFGKVRACVCARAHALHSDEQVTSIFKTRLGSIIHRRGR